MPQTRPRVRFQETSIELAHGAGGKASRRLIEGLIAPYLFESGAELRYVAEVAIAGGRLVMTGLRCSTVQRELLTKGFREKSTAPKDGACLSEGGAGRELPPISGQNGAMPARRARFCAHGPW